MSMRMYLTDSHCESHSDAVVMGLPCLRACMQAVLKGVHASRVTSGFNPPNIYIYKMNVFGQIASFGKRALGGLWLSAFMPAVLKSVHVSRVKARV